MKKQRQSRANPAAVGTFGAFCMHVLSKILPRDLQLDPTYICDFSIMHVYDLFRAIFFDVVSR